MLEDSFLEQSIRLTSIVNLSSTLRKVHAILKHVLYIFAPSAEHRGICRRNDARPVLYSVGLPGPIYTHFRKTSIRTNSGGEQNNAIRTKKSTLFPLKCDSRPAPELGKYGISYIDSCSIKVNFPLRIKQFRRAFKALLDEEPKNPGNEINT